MNKADHVAAIRFHAFRGITQFLINRHETKYNILHKPEQFERMAKLMSEKLTVKSADLMSETEWAYRFEVGIEYTDKEGVIHIEHLFVWIPKSQSSWDGQHLQATTWILEKKEEDVERQLRELGKDPVTVGIPVVGGD